MRHVLFFFFLIIGSLAYSQGNVPLHNLRHASGPDFIIRSSQNGQAAWIKDTIYFPKVYTVASTPITAKKGDFWRSTANGNTYLWDGVTWQLIAKMDGDTSSINELIQSVSYADGFLNIEDNGGTYTVDLRDTLFGTIDTTGLVALIRNVAPLTDSIAWSNVKNKPLTFTPSTHTHVIGEVTNLQDSLNVMARIVHTHTIGNITNLQDSLDKKANVYPSFVINDQETYTGTGTANSGAPRVKVGSGSFTTDDSAILINRNISGNNLFSHGVRDESTFSSGPTTGAYASFDASPTINGTTRLNHVNGHQTRLIFNNSAGADALFGHTSLFVHNGGNVTNGFGYHAATLQGSGTYTNYFGYFMEPQTNPNAFFLYSGGTSPSYIGGLLQTNGNILSSGSVKANNIWSENDFNSVGVGIGARTSSTSGFYQTLVGHNAGTNSATATTLFNTMVGASSGFTNVSGSNNTYLGAYAGYLSTGSGNVFVGRQAGFNELGSNKLYIANSDTATPLISGDFSTGNVGIATTSPTEKLHVAGNIRATSIPSYATTAAAAADGALLAGSFFKVTNGNGTSALHIKD